MNSCGECQRVQFAVAISAITLLGIILTTVFQF